MARRLASWSPGPGSPFGAQFGPAEGAERDSEAILFVNGVSQNATPPLNLRSVLDDQNGAWMLDYPYALRTRGGFVRTDSRAIQAINVNDVIVLTASYPGGRAELTGTVTRNADQGTYAEMDFKDGMLRYDGDPEPVSGAFATLQTPESAFIPDPLAVAGAQFDFWAEEVGGFESGQFLRVTAEPAQALTGVETVTLRARADDRLDAAGRVDWRGRRYDISNLARDGQYAVITMTA